MKPLSAKAKIAVAKAIDVVSIQLETFDGLEFDRGTAGWEARKKATADMSKRLGAELRMSIEDRWDGARVRYSGIYSTSTSGVVNALRNWLTVARKRLAE